MRSSRHMVTAPRPDCGFPAYISLGAVSPGPWFAHLNPCGGGGGFRATGKTAALFFGLVLTNNGDITVNDNERSY